MERATKTYEPATDTVEWEVLKKSVAVRLTPHKSPEPTEFFVNKRSWAARLRSKKCAVATARSFSWKECYVYLTPYFWKRYDKEGFGLTDMLQLFNDAQIPPFEAIQLKDFDEDRLVRQDIGDHLLYPLGFKYPLSPPYRMDYIGGVTNRNFYLKKAYEALVASQYTWEVEKIDIPYYNCNDDCNRAVEFMARLPQELFEKLCEWWKVHKKVKYWSINVKESMVFKSWWDEDSFEGADFDPDFFGLKECVKEENDDDEW